MNYQLVLQFRGDSLEDLDSTVALENELIEEFGDSADVDGHDVEALREVFDRLPLATDRPSAIICHTVKGKGIAFAENDANWHHKSKIANDVVAKLYAALE